MNWQEFLEFIVKYIFSIIALVLSVLAYLHTQKLFKETVAKPFTLKILPNGEITFWDSNRHFGTVSFTMTFYNAGNEPDEITDLNLVRLDDSFSKIKYRMYASEFLTDRFQEIAGNKIGINNPFSGIQLGPKSEKSMRITFNDNREEVFSPEMPDVFIAYKTLTNYQWRLSNVVINCDTSFEFFDLLVTRSKSIPLLLRKNKKEGTRVDHSGDQLWRTHK